MTQYNITGMSCAACVARVEKAVSQVDGVINCSVNLLTNSMIVEGDADTIAVTTAVENAGYGASVKGERTPLAVEDESVEEREIKSLKKRLYLSLVFLPFLMYFAMGHTMFHLPVPRFFANNPLVIALLQFVLSFAVILINRKFFINGYKGILNNSPNMDTLVSLGSGASFLYSLYGVYNIANAVSANDTHLAVSGLHGLYFESAAMILVLITFGKTLEAYSKGKTTSAVRGLMDLAPKTAIILVDGKEKIVGADDIRVGDVFIVKSGTAFPADGIIIEGHCAVDESAITGEGIPVDKEEGDPVSAATINKFGYVKCKATNVGADTLLSQIIKIVTDSTATKAPVARIADKISGVFVPIVIAIAAVTFIVWLLCDAEFGFALTRGISVLVISCPCALGLATPVAIMVANGVGARSGILFKSSSALECAGKTDIVALDKTGTITKGSPAVTDIITADDISEKELLSIAFSLENKSEHPIARAIVSRAKDENIPCAECDNFNVFSGNGLSADVLGVMVVGGNFNFVSGYAELSDVVSTADALAKQGKTPVFFARGNKLLGIIAVADEIRQDSVDAIRKLKSMGIKVVMITGDNEKTANAVKEKTDIDEVFAGVTPIGKESVIRDLKSRGKVAMVGDGINDAPALVAADIGVAIGGGTDVAIDAADIVLMKNRLSDVSNAINLSRATLRNIKENLFWAFVYNVIGIPVAAGVLIPAFGFELSPMFGAAAMSLSSFCVVSNALRLNLFNKNYHKGVKFAMEKIIKIEGMMCPHCSGRVKQVLEGVAGVAEAIVSHESGTAIVKLTSDVADDVLKSIVEAQGYKVI